MGRFVSLAGLRRSLATLRDRDVAGGYAMAKATTVATLPWLALWVQTIQAESGSLLTMRGVFDAVFLMGPLVTVLASVLSLVAGALLWTRYFPDSGHRALGAVTGAVLTTVCVAISTGFLLVAFSVGHIAQEGLGEPVWVVLLLLAGIGLLGAVWGLLLCIWFTLPVGAAVGWYHERKRGSRGQEDPELDVARDRAVE